jgi:carboxyl-terminal processing protease
MNQISRSLHILQSFTVGGLIATSILLLPTAGRSTPKIILKDSPKAIVDEVWQIVNDSYVDGTFHHTDWQATRRQLLSKSYTSKKQAYDSISAALKTLKDPYTRFMDPANFAALTQQTSGELSGIGVKMSVDKKTKALSILEAMPDSPASKAGIKSGDKILAIDGKSTQGMDTPQASRLVRGKPDTTVNLKIARQGQKLEVPIVRKVIQVSNVTSAVKQEGNHRIGYIRLAEFDAHADRDVRKAVQSLKDQKVDGFILDLRDNPGGLLTAAVGISNFWLNSGAIVRIVDRQKRNELIAVEPNSSPQLPLTVLVDGGSASASEILTGALKDNKRAKIVGTKTFGKAVVQEVHPLSDGSGVNVTIAHYYTPNGTDINHKGIFPDVAIALTKAQAQKLGQDPKLLASPADPQYVKAVETVSNLIQASNPAAATPSAAIDGVVPETQPSQR